MDGIYVRFYRIIIEGNILDTAFRVYSEEFLSNNRKCNWKFKK